MRQSKLYVWNGVVVWILWFIFRFGYVVYLGYMNVVKYQEIMTMPWFLVIAVWIESLTFGFLNTYWFYKITQGIVKVAMGGKHKKAEE